jgi:muramoyltetrapeptide carboxypeptidase LdcA involved in peptidoglycan recycling
VTFNGPSIMAGFAQMKNFPEAVNHVRQVLFEPTATYTYKPFPQWGVYADWRDQTNRGEVRDLRPHDGWHWLNGEGVHLGRLFGGCAEVLEFLKATPYWPEPSFWHDQILYLETSEDKPTIDYSDDEKQQLDDMIHHVVTVQFGATDLPIVSNLDFGHTDPQWIIPNGVLAEVDCAAQSFRLTEPAIR